MTGSIAPEAPNRTGEVAGFRSGTHLYRKLYDVGDAMDRLTGRLLGPEAPSVVALQETMAKSIADLRVPGKRALVSRGQITNLALNLAPGDLLLERQEGFLSNLAMPGFWKHASIHVGTPAMRRVYFDDADVQEWVRRAGEPSGCFETLLQRRYPYAYAAGTRSRDGFVMRAIESTADGVCFKALEETCAVDSLASLRPCLSKVAKAKAIARAFGFVGLPYDYRFDFATNDSFICSELVYKCFRSSRTEHALHLKLRMISGRPAIPTNDIAHYYAQHFATHGQQLELVRFFDGDVRTGRAYDGSEEVFRQSHARAAWRPHVHERRYG
ncbi:MAG: hypothetical protein H6721_24885 [Sandaracinus sp.]|nr:hypothetical protein [Sandaracinus sp.]MCB9635368.1 hypothetical protein [Sandaracinus sp.]